MTASITEVLRTLQFGDSALPIGSFSFSNGLESAVHRGLVHDVETLREFVLTATGQAASADGIALLHSYRAASEEDLDGILLADAAVFNRKLLEEARTMTTRLGRKLAELSVRLDQNGLTTDWLEKIQKGRTPGTFPVTLGLVTQSAGLTEYSAFAAHQYGVATMILSASLRLVRVDHLDTQGILYGLNAVFEHEYQAVADAALEDMATFTPQMDILVASHAKDFVRMFMS